MVGNSPVVTKALACSLSHPSSTLIVHGCSTSPLLGRVWLESRVIGAAHSSFL
jgi:hypothetical protein